MPIVQIPDPINPSLLKTVDVPNNTPQTPEPQLPVTQNDNRQPNKAGD
jgi:hypothetical protein